MTFKVVFKDPSLPDGTEVHVDGLGALVNNGTLTVSDSQADHFEVRNGYQLKDAFVDHPTIKVTGKRNINSVEPLEQPNQAQLEIKEGE